MTEFKQIIGRGTRVRDDYGKLFFNILDYTGSATRLFADPDFDGEPALVTEEEMNAAGETIRDRDREARGSHRRSDAAANPRTWRHEEEEPPRKYYVDEGSVEIAAHLVYELDPDGKQLRVVSSPTTRRRRCAACVPPRRNSARNGATPNSAPKSFEALAERGITFEELIDRVPSSPTPIRSTCSATWPTMPRFARAASGQNSFAKSRRTSSSNTAAEARQVLDELLDKYVDHGTAQFAIPEILKVPPISDRGNVIEIVAMFGGADKLAIGGQRIASAACTQLRPETHAQTTKAAKKDSRNPPPSSSAASSNPAATSCARTRASTATSTACRCSPGSCSSSSSTTWRASASEEAKLAGKRFRPAIEPPYRWRDWAANPTRHHRRRS